MIGQGTMRRLLSVDKISFNYFNITNKLSELKFKIKNFIIKYYNAGLDWISDHKGISLIAAFVLMIFLTKEYGIALFGIIIYLLILKKEKNDHEREMDYLKIIDFKLLDDTENGLSSILDKYINDCFNRDVVFFRGIKDKEYINTKDEKDMLDTLMNSAISNISPLLRKKIDLYYGEGQSDIIIGRKCFIVVSLFVANNNKAIYNK